MNVTFILLKPETELSLGYTKPGWRLRHEVLEALFLWIQVLLFSALSSFRNDSSTAHPDASKIYTGNPFQVTDVEGAWV